MLNDDELKTLSFDEALFLQPENLLRWIELNPEKWEAVVKELRKERTQGDY